MIMKRICLILLSLATILSCSKDDGEDPGTARLYNTYEKLRSEISGTWVMDGYHTSSPISQLQSLGWEENLTYWAKTTIYKLTFTSDWKVTDNDGNNSTYTIYMDESKNVYYGSDNDSFNWPFTTGAVYLKLNGDIDPSYYNPYYAEIKSDGKLYLYNTAADLGGDGRPKYRYRRN